MNRVTFLVDGFNLYHSLVQAQGDNGNHCVKWLDLSRLCRGYLHVVRQQVKVEVGSEAIHYFSAPPTHRSQETQNRHALYMGCLKASGIRVHLARFKKRIVRCPLCNGEAVRHEEKETDVALATQLLEICHSGEAESVVIVTGDTDLAPTVRTCKRLFPDVFICFAFPYKRDSSELKRLSPGSFKISRDAYLKHQYPDPLELSDGRTVTKPPQW